MSDEQYWALVLYHGTGPDEIGVVGPFGTREKAEEHQREHGPRLAIMIQWEHIPTGPKVYRTTPRKAIERAWMR